VNVGNLLISQPDTGEQALEITDALVRSGSVDLIVIDSVAALVPKAEIEGEMGDSLPGLQARLMSQALRKLTGTIKRTNCLVIFINQIRMKIGVMFGSPETTTGGNALKFYASVRLDIRRIGSIKKGDEVVGNETKVKVVKNKVRRRASRVRHPLRPGISRRARSSTWAWTPRSSRSRRLVQLQRREDRPGQGQRPRVPAREPGHRRRDREQGASGAGRGAAEPWRARRQRSKADLTCLTKAVAYLCGGFFVFTPISVSCSTPASSSAECPVPPLSLKARAVGYLSRRSTAGPNWRASWRLMPNRRGGGGSARCSNATTGCPMSGSSIASPPPGQSLRRGAYAGSQDAPTRQ
jgi:hypothetical protein